MARKKALKTTAYAVGANQIMGGIKENLDETQRDREVSPRPTGGEVLDPNFSGGLYPIPSPRVHSRMQESKAFGLAALSGIEQLASGPTANHSELVTRTVALAGIHAQLCVSAQIGALVFAVCELTETIRANGDQIGEGLNIASNMADDMAKLVTQGRGDFS